LISSKFVEQSNPADLPGFFWTSTEFKVSESTSKVKSLPAITRLNFDFSLNIESALTERIDKFVWLWKFYILK
jgi:hypothetical protein